MSDLAIRASDAERDAVVVQLRGHLVEGRLTPDEFADRIDEAYRARTRDELVLVLRELPEPVAPRRRRFPWPLSVAVFSHIKRRRRWRVARLHIAVAVFGSLTLDLRSAELGGTTVILALPLFGSVDVLVPLGMDASLGGIAVFGSHDEEVSDDVVEALPSVHVVALTVFGSTEVRVPRRKRGKLPAAPRPEAGR
jgi:hypothetical protein